MVAQQGDGCSMPGVASLMAQGTSSAFHDAAGHTSSNSTSSSGIRQQLDGAAVHTSLLQDVMRRELQALTPGAQQLRLARQCMQQQQGGTAGDVAQADAPSEDGASTASKAERIVVAPVLGLCLQHILAEASAAAAAAPNNTKPAARQGSAVPAPAGEKAEGSASAQLCAAMRACSPFLNVLECELHSLQQVSASCYSQLRHDLAALGQLLPPDAGSADDESSTSTSTSSPDAAAGPPLSSSSSASSPPPPPPPPASPAHYYGAGLDLPALRRQADAAAYDLIHLEDFVASSIASLAALAQRYDVMLTAAVAAADQHASGTPAAAVLRLGDASAAQDAALRAPDGPSAAAAGSTNASSTSASGREKGGGLSFLGPLLDAVRPSGASKAQRSGPQAAAAASAAAASGGGEDGMDAGATFVWATAGVCSHSNPDPLHCYRAGMPPDVYHSSMHHLLTIGSCCELVLWMLSVLHARLRHAAAEASAAAAQHATGQQARLGAGGAKEWKAPDKFTRCTTKYWVHPANILRLKVALIRHLPLLVYGSADPVSAGDVPAAAAAGCVPAAAGSGRAAAAAATPAASLVSSVYFDGPELDTYHTRLARDDGARLARIRFYGRRVPGAAGAQQTVFVEQKTHKEKWTEERSFKERASLPQAQLPAYLAGSLDLAAAAPSASKLVLLQEVQAFLAETQQAPVLRTEYLRTAWQAYDDNAVRLSLDEHMLLLREGPGPDGTTETENGAAVTDWCRPLELLPAVPASDAVRFPYGILEIKLQDKAAAPEWVLELQASGVLVEVPRFSKFLHGMALLHAQRVRSLPPWFAWDAAAGAALPVGLADAWEAARERRLRLELARQFELDDTTISTTAPTVAQAQPAPPSPAAQSALTPPGLSPLKVPRLLEAHAAPPGGLAMLGSAADSPRIHLTATAGSAPWDDAQTLPPHAAAGGRMAATDATAALLYGRGSTAQGPAGLTSFPCSLPTSRGTSCASNLAAAAAASGGGRGAGAAPPSAHLGIMADGQFSCCGGAAAGGGGGGWGAFGGSMHVSSAAAGLLHVLPGSPIGASQPCRRRSLAALGRDSPPLEHLGDTTSSPFPVGASPTHMHVTVPGPLARHGVTDQQPQQHRPHNHYQHWRRSSLGSCSMWSSADSQDSLTTTSSDGVGVLCSFGAGSPFAAGTPPSLAAALRSSAGCPDSGIHSGSLSGAAVLVSSQGLSSRLGPSRLGPRHPSASSLASDSWRLPAIKASSAAADQEPGARSKPLGSSSEAESKAALMRSSDIEACGDAGTTAAAAGADGLLGRVRPCDVVVNLGHLVAPSGAAAARLAGAGQPGVLQVCHAGAAAPPHPSAAQARSMSQLLPPAPANGISHAAAGLNGRHAAAAPLLVAATAASGPAPAAASATIDGMSGRAGGTAALSSSGSGSGGAARQGRLRRKLQQWRVALGGRLGGRGGRGAALVPTASGGSLRKGSANEHTLGFTGSGPRNASFMMTRVEPKTFFANERTFLAWLHIAVLVMMTGLGLLTGSTIVAVGEGGCMANMICSASRISGAIIAPVSICFMLYALHLFRKRTHQILSRSTLRYDDQRGPVLLTLLLVGVTLVCIVLALQAFRLSSGGAPAAASVGGRHHTGNASAPAPSGGGAGAGGFLGRL